MTRRAFTPAERAYIAAHYATMSAAELAAALGRHFTSVKNYLARNQLAKGVPSATRFKKGLVPWNKGRKGLANPGSEKGYFQKGSVPHNATGYYDGMVVVRHKKGEPAPYKYRRLASRCWVLSHRHNWAQENGPIPAGHVLRCRTPDTLNDAPANWELLTLAENAARNAIHAERRASAVLTPNYLAGTLTKGRPELRAAVLASPELLEVQRLKITLNRTLKHGLGHAN